MNVKLHSVAKAAVEVGLHLPFHWVIDSRRDFGKPASGVGLLEPPALSDVLDQRNHITVLRDNVNAQNPAAHSDRVQCMKRVKSIFRRDIPLECQRLNILESPCFSQACLFLVFQDEIARAIVPD